jgi:hypothetical protein
MACGAASALEARIGESLQKNFSFTGVEITANSSSVSDICPVPGAHDADCLVFATIASLHPLGWPPAEPAGRERAAHDLARNNSRTDASSCAVSRARSLLRSPATAIGAPSASRMRRPARGARPARHHRRRPADREWHTRPPGRDREPRRPVAELVHPLVGVAKTLRINFGLGDDLGENLVEETDHRQPRTFSLVLDFLGLSFSRLSHRLPCPIWLTKSLRFEIVNVGQRADGRLTLGVPTSRTVCPGIAGDRYSTAVV